MTFVEKVPSTRVLPLTWSLAAGVVVPIPTRSLPVVRCTTVPESVQPS
jgi:hypothetical protein